MSRTIVLSEAEAGALRELLRRACLFERSGADALCEDIDLRALGRVAAVLGSPEVAEAFGALAKARRGRS